MDYQESTGIKYWERSTQYHLDKEQWEKRLR